MQLVLNSKGLHLSRYQGRFELRLGEEVQRISPQRVTSIAITRQVHVDTDALLLAVEHEIPVLLLDRFGRVRGRFWSAHFASIATLRRRQVYFADRPEAVGWVREVLVVKLLEAQKVLTYLKRRRQNRKSEIDDARYRLQRGEAQLKEVVADTIGEVRNRLMGIEGSAMKAYWQCVGSVVPDELQFTKRSRRPAQDAFNAGINYYYGMLYGVVESALFAVGLDPHLGILHVDQHDSPTLAFDLIEPFRPWFDRLLLEYAFDGLLNRDLFTDVPKGMLLSKAGKQLLIPAFNDHLHDHYRFRGRQLSRQQHIYQAANRLAKLIRDPDEYHTEAPEEELEE